MGLEYQHTSQFDKSYQDAALDSEASGELLNVNSVETGFHILASMLAEYHLRQKDSYKHNPSDKEPNNSPL